VSLRMPVAAELEVPSMAMSRRSFLTRVPAGVVLPAWSPQSPPTGSVAIPESFPSQDPALVREMVGVSHGNVARVRELLSQRPALAKASWDWGFGDWECALGAASHVGNREIAELLLSTGARPTLFSAAMLGQLDTVKAFVAASPGIQKTPGPHGISLLSHAKAGGAADVVKYLEALGDADIRFTAEPLSEPDRTAVLGTYAFGSGASDRLTTSINSRGALVMKREGGSDRVLHHGGSRVFHPVGAEAVRIRFDAGSPSPGVTVEDGAIVLKAQRV